MCATPVAGQLADRFGYRPFLILGALCQGSGIAWIAAVASPGVGYGAVVAPLVVMGLGVSMYFPAIAGTVTSSVPRQDAGVAAGTNTALRQLGSVFGVAIMSVVFARYGGYGSRTAFLHGFRPAMAVAAGVSLSSVVAAVLAPGKPRAAETGRMAAACRRSPLRSGRSGECGPCAESSPSRGRPRTSATSGSRGPSHETAIPAHPHGTGHRGPIIHHHRRPDATNVSTDTPMSQSLDPARPFGLRRIAARGPGVVGQGVAVQHHGVGAGPAEGAEPGLGGVDQRPPIPRRRWTRRPRAGRRGSATRPSRR